MTNRRPVRLKTWHVCVLVSLTIALLGVARVWHASSTPRRSDSGKEGIRLVALTPSPKQVEEVHSPVTPFRDCDFAAEGGTWEKRGTIDGDGDGSSNATALPLDAPPTKAPVKEHLLYWHPLHTTTRRCLAREQSSLRSWRRFTQKDALQCLEGKQLLFYGNSNTRTIYIALEALLRNKRMTSRVAAKQMCDNSKTNHSCWTTIEVEGYKPIRASYVSYVQDLFHDELDRKIPVAKRKTFDLIVGNSGLNAIQNFDNKKVRDDHLTNVPKLRKFVASFSKIVGDDRDERRQDPMFLWHATTPICPNQPHFKRYLYNAKHWRYRTVDQINEAVIMSNQIVFERVFGVPFSGGGTSRQPLPKDAPFTVDGLDIAVVDDWSMMTRRVAADGEGLAAGDGNEKKAAAFDLCPFFEDPLHHRFLDREVVQNMLNMYCPLA